MKNVNRIARNVVTAWWSAPSLKSMLQITNATLDALVRGQVEGYKFVDEIKDSDFVRIVIAENATSKFYYLFYITPKMRYAEIETFRSEQNARAYAQRVADKYNSRAQRALERKEERKQQKQTFQNPYKVGDYLVCSWGYDQTNIDFYKVISVTNASVKIVEVSKKVVGHSTGEDAVVPDSKTIGSPMIKRVGDNGWVRISSFEFAHKWGGKPEWKTDAYSGH